MLSTRRSFLRAAAGVATASRAAFTQTSRPNILFIIFDDWSHGHAGAYGCTWIKTPHFDRIAREGVLFTNCFTSNPKCSPCRASILTGRNTWQLKEAVSHFSIFPNEFPVYPDLLEKAGYTVGLTGKGWGPGDYQSTGWKRNPAGPEFRKFTNKPPYDGIGNLDYASNFNFFLDQRPKDKPFCFWMGFTEPHRRYEDGSGIRAGKSPAEVTLPKYFPDNRTVRSDMLDYALEVEWADSHIGRALKKLEETGELDNTLIVVTSDHGQPFPRVKGQIYEHGFHVPLAVRWGKNIAPGRTIDDFINVRDFAPTFLEAAGVAKAGAITGRSFLDVLKSGKSGRVDASRNVMLVGKERHDLGRPNDAGYPVRAIRTDQFLYVRNFVPDSWPAGNPETGYRNVDDSPTKTLIISSFDEYYRMAFGKRPAEELYDVKADPDCVHNLAAVAKFAQTKRELRDRMMTMLRQEEDPRALGNESFFDTIEYTGGKKHSYDAWLKNQKN
ncbi:MAG: sulfatase [Bryobacterales bacterium]|nr:sulfatase [Bryobacterales bacterium]